MQNKLPNDPTALVLAIVSLLISVTVGCVGLGIVGLILAIIALVQTGNSQRALALRPQFYSPKSISAIHTARVVGWIALVINIIATLVSIAYFVIIFLVGMSDNGSTTEDFQEEYYEDEDWDEDDYDRWEYVDSLDQDIEEIQTI